MAGKALGSFHNGPCFDAIKNVMLKIFSIFSMIPTFLRLVFQPLISLCVDDGMAFKCSFWLANEKVNLHKQNIVDP